MGHMFFYLGAKIYGAKRQALVPMRLAPSTLPHQRNDARGLAPMTLASCRYILAPTTMAPRTWSIFLKSFRQGYI
jgi:hypothetical protein